MRRRLSALVTTLAVLTVCTLAPAAQQKRPSAQDAQGNAPGITSVTDANGNPLPLREGAATDAKALGLQPSTEMVQRGQGWWPYGSARPPYTFVNKPAESMTDNEIQVNGVALIDIRDTEATLKLIPTELKLADGAQLTERSGFYLLKIAGMSRTQEQIDALKSAGVVLGEYMNINTYMAMIPATSFNTVRSLPFVSFIGDYEPAYKISPRIGLESIPVTEAIDAASGRPKTWVFEVTLHNGADLKDTLDGLARYGMFPEKSDIVSTDELTMIYVRTVPENVLTIAQLPQVKWIAEKTYSRLLASATNPATIPMILQNNAAFTTNKALGWKLWNAGIDGTATSQIVTIMDTGLDTNVEHMAQSSTAVGTVGPSHRKVVAYNLYGGDQCVLSVSGADEGHGTWTTQHAVGSISNMSANPDTTHTPTENYDNGIARGAKVNFQDIGDSAGAIHPPTDLGPSITQAISVGSFVQNHSWGSSSPTYDTNSSFLDTALFNNPNFVVTVSAGNQGAAGNSTIGAPSTAKNCITVGGNNISTPDALFIDCNWDGVAACDASADLGSSRGPVTTSNRIKPDIMTYVFSSAVVGGEQEAINEPAAMCQTDATKNVHWNYVNAHGFGGTSFAAPEVAGLAAVVRDYFMQGFYPTGSAVGGNAFTPSGSLVKAVILASGEVMSTQSSPSVQTIQSRYSSDVGYGRANVPGVLHIGAAAPFLWVQNNVNLGQGATQSFFYNINGNAIPLRVLMVWYDAAGNTIQKNADLRVTIGANVYRGNVMTSGWSTTGGVADATNPTEGVFLDSAHGLPSSGTVQVEVIGTNNPGGMNYSLVVVGNVASALVKQVSLDKGQYTCTGPITVSVNDTGATSPVSVTLTSRNSVSAVIDTKVVSCTGSGGVFSGSIVAGSGISVVNSGTVTATYSDASPATATIACQAVLTNGGFIVGGGCDNAAAGTDIATGPLTNGGLNEYYNKYMDAGEYTSYKFAFVNNTGAALSDVYVALSFSGAGSGFMSAFNGPIHVGPVAAGATAGGVFQLFTSAATPGLTSVNLNFAITSPADGYTTPTTITQVQLLQSNDQIARQIRCSTFDTLAAFNTWSESAVAGVANPWRWINSATVSSETRVGGLCSSAVANAAAMVGNAGTTPASTNFTANADSVLLQNFQPALTGNGPNGQPYHYAWAWHSFYHASESLGSTTGAWGVWYNDQWNSPVAPTGAQVVGFSNSVCCYYQTIFDYVGTWNWETANTGTPDVPGAATPAPNQLIITFGNVTGLATPSTYFTYGHEHFDINATATNNRDIALDNDNLVYDEYYAAAQPAACGAGTQVGQVAFDQISYATCPTGSAVLSVLDGNGVSGMTVTVTSPGTGDSELVTLTGSAPYFTGTLTFSTVTGVGNNNGTLFVLPTENITATYTDSSPAGSSTALATVSCTGGDVVYVTNSQVSDNGDNDGIADNNECVTLDITIKNNLATSLTNTKVTIVSNNNRVDLIPDDHAYYGTVAAGATATNPSGDRFTFHVASSVACSDPANPPSASFTVVITGDGINGAAALQTFAFSIDLDIGAGTVSYTQNFTVNPGWTTGVTAPDNAGCTANSYTNDFHWCAACGNAGAGYGAWVGNLAFGGTQNYTSAYNSSTLFSPVFTAGSTAVTMAFRQAYRTETPYDGAIAQYKLGAGDWTTLGYTTPAQAATTAGNSCSPILASTVAWTGTATGTTWTLTNAASVTTTAGQSIQFRWRLGGDVSVAGTTYGGFGVDDVTVTGLRNFTCETTRPSGVGTCCLAPSILTNNTAVDANLCTTSGIQITWPVDPDNWGDGGVGTRTYDVLRNGSPIASGIAYGTTSYLDASAVPGTTYTYTVRYNNGCGGSAITTGVSRADSGAITCSASDQCHVAGVCAPATGNCSNPTQPNGNACNDANACTQTDTCQSGVCTGTNPVVCNASDQCHDVGVCNTGTGVCSNPAKANGSTCADGNQCTLSDTCQSGVCTSGAPVVCTASDQCHVAGVCNPGTGVCTNPNAPNGNACNDANACTQTDTCQSGICTGANPVVCTASDQCHVAGVCNTGTGVCSNPNAGNGTTCNDGSACSQTDTCQSGICTGSNPVICTASDQCHVAGVCNTGTGVCTNPNAGNGTTCNDGNACSQTDTCQAGVCTGSNPVICTASDQCHVAGVCNTGTGVCSNPNAPNGNACSDGNACSQTDTCQSGVCTGSNPVICTASDQCHVAGVCNTGTGVCSNPNAPNGNACSDGNACSQTDTCQSGVCTGSNPVICTASDQCHVAGVCNTGTGVCSNPAAADGVTCTDNNACTNGDSCQSGVCSAGAPTVCTASDQCHIAGVCNTGTGVCSNPAAADGISCTDNNACTNGDSCQSGVCSAGTPTVCTASDQCHVAGVCDTGTGFCSNPAAADGVSCTDNNACTTGDSCQSGVCSAGTPTVCTASDQCHVAGVCDTGTGVCSNPAAADGVSCSDNNACTTGDSCQSGACSAGTPTVCTASDQCHMAGVCDTGTGFCSNPAAADGVSCSDNNACTTGDSCQSGACSAGTPTVCTASDQCHVAGTCNPGTGVCSNPNASDGITCNDGSACSQTDTCQSGVCTGSNPVVCTASDQCHVAGVCNPGTGVCSDPAAPDGSFCSDGGTDQCANSHACQGGVCVNSDPVICQPLDQCHVAGVCIPSTGLCTNPPIADGTGCNDSNACTQSDSCQAGACVGASPVVCTASDQCHVAGVCNPGTGFCSDPAAANGTSCTDNNSCTNGDSCQAGACSSGAPTVCSASDQCHVAGVCDTGTGFCSNPAAANGVACSDSNACTNGDTCQSGACSSGAPTVCSASDQCHVAGVCDTGTGFCSNPAAADGVSCTDNNSCTQSDSCQTGVCVGASPVVCTASDQCHVAGVCNPGTGFCSNPAAADGVSCSDNNACTTGDSCQSGACSAGTPTVCTASDQCHVAGTCDSGTGACSNPAAADGVLCTDNNACTTGDSCQSGACAAGVPTVCTASDQCHVAGTCDTGTGACSNPAAADGVLCTDNNACTTGDSCQSGACSAGTPTVCTASDQCHVAGTCDSGTGACSNPATANGVLCTDNNACTTGDSCQSGACASGAPTVCSPSDQCHVAGVCDTGSGFCSNPVAPNGTACNDGSQCTSGDVCGAGSCSGTPVPPPGAVNDSVRVDKTPTNATISWNDPPAAYDVYRGSKPAASTFTYNQTCLSTNVLGNSTTDGATPLSGELYFYLVTRIDACNESSLGTDSAGATRPNTSACVMP